MSMRTGTHHFTNFAAAEKFYEGTAAANQKIREGAIVIGRPEPKASCWLSVDSDGRYWYVENDDKAANATGVPDETPLSVALCQLVGRLDNASPKELIATRKELHAMGADYSVRASARSIAKILERAIALANKV